MKKIIRSTLRKFGYDIRPYDPLIEQIPGDYAQSPFLPHVGTGVIDKLCYYVDVFERTRELEGDIVECGVSIGHGALQFLLISQYIDKPRTYYGYDSFEGFPLPAEKDEVTPIKGEGFYANAPAAVLRTLRDGRLSDELIRDRVRLVKGWFDETVPKHEGPIAVLHLDCDLYESYKICLESLYPQVVSGGIIMFDEYNDKRWPGATKAIDEFFEDKPESPQPHEKCNWKYHVVKQ